MCGRILTVSVLHLADNKSPTISNQNQGDGKDRADGEPLLLPGRGRQKPAGGRFSILNCKDIYHFSFNVKKIYIYIQTYVTWVLLDLGLTESQKTRYLARQT